MRHLRKRNLYLIVFNGLSYGQPIFIYIASKLTTNDKNGEATLENSLVLQYRRNQRPINFSIVDVVYDNLRLSSLNH